MAALQELIHKLEMGVGVRYLRILLAALALVTLIAGYNWRSFRNFSTQEAMDSAQLGRNIAEGRGYTTEFIRPFSMFLIKRANQERLGSLTEEQRKDLSRVKGRHPDIANPPVYPVVLAGWMKTYPALLSAVNVVRDLLPGFAKKRMPVFDTRSDNPLWQDGYSRFARHPHDFFIAMLNEVFLLGLVVLTFFLARKLFDPQVAWLSAILLLCTELLWKFSVAGLSTMLLLLLFLGLVWALVRLEAGAREEPAASGKSMITLAAVIGLLLGVGMLTRYSYGFLLLPVLGFVALFGGRWRVSGLLVIVAVFAVVVTPWLVRNVSVCGMPFGTAGYAPLETSSYFPQHRLERSLEPNFAQIQLAPLLGKFFVSLRPVLLNDLPRLGGSWISGFFLGGLLIGFRNPALSRLRYFVVAALGTFVVVQAVGHTALTEDSPEVNSENLLILLLPLILIYGVGFFHIMLDQTRLAFPWLRTAAIALFGVLISLPLIFSFLPPRTYTVAFPPYNPPDIQQISSWMGADELIMSDIPWAVAWYGDRQSILLTLNVLKEKPNDPTPDFYLINDYIKPVNALYLTPASMDAKFISSWLLGGTERSWGTLILASMNYQTLPPGFPLSKSVKLYQSLFLADWERWRKPEAPEVRP